MRHNILPLPSHSPPALRLPCPELSPARENMRSGGVRAPLLPQSESFEIGHESAARPRRRPAGRGAGVVSWLTLLVFVLVAASVIDVKVRDQRPKRVSATAVGVSSSDTVKAARGPASSRTRGTKPASKVSTAVAPSSSPLAAVGAAAQEAPPGTTAWELTTGLGPVASPVALAPPAGGWVPASQVLSSVTSEGALPAGFPPGPPGLPALQWADDFWWKYLGAPAPAQLPPAPPQLSRAQWAAQWVYGRQQAAANAKAQAAGADHAWAAAPAPGSGPGSEVLTFRSLASYDSLAVCNDGSPAGFYYAPGDPTTWLVYLEGGLWCWDAESCAQRGQNGPEQVSSTAWPATMAQQGIFDSNSSLNPFASASKVYVGYCSSDGWTGDVDAATTQALHGFEWAFRGRRILRATLDLLVADLGLGSSASTTAPHKLLLSGCSAGARGAMYNLDVAAAAAPKGVQVYGLLDSPLWLNVQPMDPAIPSLEAQCAAALPLFNVTQLLNAACLANLALVNASASPSLCLMGQYLMPYLNAPYFLNAGQFDSFQIPYNVGGMPSVSNVAQMAYVDAWQDTLLSVLNGLPSAAQTDSGVFSLSCLRHCLTEGPAFWSARILNNSLASASSAWFYGDSGGGRFVGSCETYQRCVMC